MTTKKECPILFNTEMVRAVLDGRKTQTRRVMKPQLIIEPWHVPQDSIKIRGKKDFYFFWEDFIKSECPFGQPGDRLWVRETFYNDVPDARDPDHFYYRADGECCDQIPECQCASEGSKWKPSIHMPRWASRITLEIVDVRVERLQEISEEDAKAEGVEFGSNADGTCGGWGGASSFREAFLMLWNKLFGPTEYKEPNPWVWVVTFRRVEA